MLALFARCPCQSRLLTLRRLATNAVSTNEAANPTLAEASTSAPANEASVASAEPPRTGRATSLTLGDVQNATQLCSAGPQRVPAWWSDERVDAYGAYKIIMKRFKHHGSQRDLSTPLWLFVNLEFCCWTLEWQVASATHMHSSANMQSKVHFKVTGVV